MGKKKLIDERAVRDMKAAGVVCIEVDEDTILTPSARDAAGALRMQVRKKTEAGTSEPAQLTDRTDQIDPDLIYRVLKGLISRGLLTLPEHDGISVRAPETAEAEGMVGLNQMQAMIGSLAKAMKGE